MHLLSVHIIHPAPSGNSLNISATPSEQTLSPAGNFATRLTTYKTWRNELVSAIQTYREWLAAHEEFPLADNDFLDRLSAALDSDKVTLAIVGEFSRGKTELLNALFFSDFDQRLLPTSAGRTTMCPTELRYDEKEGAQIRLLPIETRKTSMTIAEYRKNPVHWKVIHILRPNSPDDLHQAFLEVTKTKRVHVREAQELGLYDPATNDMGQPDTRDDMVEVPLWRHAIVNYPHPLLRQGLVVLDTPGLNALGAEPELTLSMLPSADAVLFLLGAETGVTRSDMDVWKNHVCQSISTRGHEHVVVLNKVDILWDSLTDEVSQRRVIAQQVSDTAKQLGVERSSVFALSAKHGLMGRIRKDNALLERSGLRALENKLADDVIPNRYEIVRRRIVYDFSHHLGRSRDYLQERLRGLEKQIADLKSLGGQNVGNLQEIIQRMREERARYEREMAHFQEIRRILAGKAEKLFDHLGMSNVDRLAAQTRDSMKGSWTTQGLRTAMAAFFEGISATMEEVRRMSMAIQKDLNQICEQIHKDFGLTRVHPVHLTLVTPLLDLKKLESKGESFRNSTTVIVTEQNRVIDRFFATLVGEARRHFESANELARNWFRDVGVQIFGSIQAHKAAIDREIETLRMVHENVDNLAGQIQTLEGRRQSLRNEIEAIVRIQRRIEPPVR